MKNAVVFGATGQLGCYSAIALKEDGYNVYAVGRRNNDNGFFETKGITFIGGVDVSDKSTFDRLPKEKIDVVVNMAGTMPAHANRDMMPYVQSIIVGTVNITEWMKTVECQRIHSRLLMVCALILELVPIIIIRHLAMVDIACRRIQSSFWQTMKMFRRT